MDLSKKIFAVFAILCIVASAGVVCASEDGDGAYAGSNYDDRGGWAGSNYEDHGGWAGSNYQDNGENSIIAVSNFTPTTHEGYRLGVPTKGKYKVVLNTDSKCYWGSNYDVGGEVFEASDISWHGQYHSIVLNLPPLATIFIKRIGD